MVNMGGVKCAIYQQDNLNSSPNGDFFDIPFSCRFFRPITLFC